MIKSLSLVLLLVAGLLPEIGVCGLIGEPAPQLNLRDWVKGQPVKVGPGTNIVLLEIWNTASPSCRAAITNLNAVQKRYETNGLIVVGVSDEPIDKIRSFLGRDGTNVEYRIAQDNKRFTSLTYMNPVGERTVPYVFVVGTNGDLLWHGSPHSPLMGEAVENIIKGTYDEKLVQKMDLAKHQMRQYIALAAEGSDRAGVAGKNLLAARTNDVALLCDLAYTIATYPKLAVRDFGLADEAMSEAAKLVGTNSTQIAINRAIVLFESGQRSEGLNLATQALTFAQSPAETNYVHACIRSMEARKSLPLPKSGEPATNGTAHAVSGSGQSGAGGGDKAASGK